MNHEQRESWSQELLEYHYGCHPDPETIERRLGEDPAFRAFYRDHVEEMATLIDRASRGESLDVHKLMDSISGTRDKGISSWTARRWMKIAALVVLSAVVGMFATSSWMTLRADRIRESRLRVSVEGPARIPEMSVGHVQIETRDARGDLVASRLAWTLRGDDGQSLSTGEAQSDGRLRLALPVLREPSRSLDVTAYATLSSGEVSAECRWIVSASRSSVLGHLSSDRPSYPLGDPVYVRALFLDPVTLAPVEGRYHLRVTDPKDDVIESRWIRTQDGVAAFAWYTDGARESVGVYRIGWAESDQGEAIEEIEILLRGTDPPRLQKSIVPSAPRFRSGEVGDVLFTASRLGGGPVAHSVVNGTLSLEGDILWEGSAMTDASGRAKISLMIPEDAPSGEALLAMRVNDDGWYETATAMIALVQGIPKIQFYPEGGDLIADVPSRVYVECVDELGFPMAVTGVIENGDGERVSSLDIPPSGRSRFELTPSKTDYRYVLQDGTLFDLPPVRDQGVVIRARDDLVSSKSAIRIDLHTPDDREWTAVVFRRGVAVAEEVVQGQGLHRLALDPGQAVFGVLRVTVFDQELRPRAERLVYRESDRYLDVSCEIDTTVLAPGDEQRVRIRLTDEDGAGVQGLLGVSVFDRAASLASISTPTSLRDFVALGADIASIEDVSEFVLRDEESARALDLLLGTRGWRRFAWYELESDSARPENRPRDRRFEILAYQEGGSSLTEKASSGDQEEQRARSLKKSSRTLQEIAIASTLLLIACVILFYSIRISWRGMATSTKSPWVRVVVSVVQGLSVVIVLVLGVVFLIYPRLGSRAPGFETEDAAVWSRGPTGAIESELVESKMGDDSEQLDALSDALDLAWLELDDGDDETVQVSRRRVSVYVREYAHAYRESATDWLRNDLTETLYWSAGLQTDEEGWAELSFDVSDRLTTWDIRVDAVGRLDDSLYAVGEGSASFQSRSPLEIDVKAPWIARSGDSLALPLGIRRDGPGDDPVLVRWKAQGLELAEDRGVWEPDGSSDRLTVPLDIPDGFEGRLPILIIGKWGRHVDGIRRVIEVLPRSFEKHVTRSGWLIDEERIGLDLPRDVDLADLSANLTVYPSALDTLWDGIEGMLREPHGCFEQVSSSTYPNLLILTLINDWTDGTTEIQQKAMSYLAQGYEKLVDYEVEGGGFDWFGRAPANVTLTAYGLMEFVDMARVFPVDEALIARTREWLLQRRDGEGGFDLDGRIFRGFPEESARAYITWALLQSGVEQGDVEPELDGLTARVEETKDAYELALIALGLGSTDRYRAAARARQRLVDLQSEAGFVGGDVASWTGSGEQDAKVETTSLSILAWIDDPAMGAPLERAMGWILARRSHDGRFGATQATILALKALLAYQRMERRTLEPGTLELFVNEERASQRSLGPRSKHAVRLGGLKRLLAPGRQEIELRYSASGELPWTVDLSYRSLKPSDDSGAPLAVDLVDRTIEVEEGEIVELELRISHLRMQPASMGLAVIGLPSTVDPRPENLERLRENGAFDFWEIRDHELILYWRAFDAEEIKTVSLELIGSVPGRGFGRASRSYLYYTPQLVSWAEPLEAVVKPAPR